MPEKPMSRKIDQQGAMANSGKVDFMSDITWQSVRVQKDVLDSIDPTVYKATGLRVKLQDFVTDAIREKLAGYVEMADKKAKKLPRTGTEG